MTKHYKVLSAQEIEDLTDPSAELAFDVLQGLSERPKRLPSKYFYDDQGSRLFSQIMKLDEYYLTNCEHEILSRHGRAILGATGSGPLTLIDMGAGDGTKTLLLLEQLQEDGRASRYVPLDISEGAMAGLATTVQAHCPGLRFEGVVAEYFSGLKWLAQQPRWSDHEDSHRLVLFLGSNIGNLDRPRSRTFLRRLWTALDHGDYVLIGFDLKKDIDVLLRAYNDEQGVTAAFNKNLLARINRELGGHFAPEKFRHFSTYNVFSGAMESYLVSLDAQEVAVDGLNTRFRFREWEPIHTEYSYKYLRSDIERLAAESGYVIREHFLDSDGSFVDSLWRVEKPENR